MRLAALSAFVALLVTTAVVQAQGALPADLDARLQAALAEAGRATQTYPGLANPVIAEQSARQARQRADADIARTVLATIAERPDLGPAIVERAAQLAPQSAATIRASARGAYPAMGAGNTGTAAYAAVPSQWYAPAPASPRAAPAPAVIRASAPAEAAVPIPGTWYDQPLLRRYGVAGVSPAPAAPVVQAPAVGSQAPAAPAASGDVETVWDPLEGLNRVFHAVNQGLDFILLRPVAWTYSFVPGEIKGMVRSALFNLREPLNAANSLLQGEVTYAGKAVGRFVANTTIGIGGLADVAEPIFGWAPSRADFGQTLYVWGLGAGPYVEAPLLGPSNARDLVGTAVDFVADPFGYVILDQAARYVRTGSTIVSTREELLEPLDELKAGSVDYYVTLREASQARRKVELDRGEPGKLTGPSGKSADQLFDEAK